MRHTNIQSEIKRLQEMEMRELVNALKAHGGVYTWYAVDDAYELDYEAFEDFECGDLKLPTVLMLPEYGESTYKLAICEAFVDSQGAVVFTGFNVNGDLDIICCEAEYAASGEISDIIDQIPETEGVKDVSCLKSKPVLSLDRYDLDDEGFDSSKVTDEQLTKLANAIGDSFVKYGFYDTLREIANKMNLPHKTEE